MHVVHRLLVYIFPGILFAFEWLLLTISNINVALAIGPSLAAGALGLLLPLTTPKIKDSVLSDDAMEILRKDGYILVKQRDTLFSSFYLFLLLIFLALWAYVAIISVTGKIPVLMNKDWRWDLIIGAVSYVVAAALAEVKESF
jgi:hypothetical protein